MKNIRFVLFVVATVALLTSCGTTRGHGNDFDNVTSACVGKVEGDKVTVKGMRGEADMQATCKISPRNGRLFPMPDTMTSFIDTLKTACVGKNEGDVVQVTNPKGRIIDAVCKHENNMFLAIPKMK